MTDFTIKSNDTVPIQVQLTRDGSAVDLSSADVRFLMRSAGEDTVTVDSTATIDDATGGRVSYQWTSSDTADPGLYLIEWEVTFNPGTVDEYIETFPPDDYLDLRIIDDIA